MTVVGPDVPPAVAKRILTFYEVSDWDTHDEYMACFTPDAKFNIVAPRQGHEQILQGRIWGMTTRTNQVHRVSHIWKTEDNTYLVLGDIDFDRNADGAKIRNLPFVGRLRMTTDADPKIEDYYVWVVSWVNCFADASDSRPCSRARTRTTSITRSAAMHDMLSIWLWVLGNHVPGPRTAWAMPAA